MQYWSERAKILSPYVPGEQPKQGTRYIKLNTNENPYPPSKNALDAMRNVICDTLRLYPDPESVSLREGIARRENINPNQVFVGNGSDEILGLAFMALANPSPGIRFFDITYSFYPVYAKLFGINPIVIPLKDDFSVDVDACMGNTAPIIFPNPNAPTSLVLSIGDIRRIAEGNNKHAVIVDEAYAEFGAESAVSLIGECPNIIVIKTFSKSHSLAGLRVGYAIADENIIRAFSGVKNSFNSYPVDRVAQVGALAAINDEEYAQECIKKIVANRVYAKKKLEHLGFDVLDSRANFLFITHPNLWADVIMQGLRERGVLVRHFNSERTQNYLRITIGTHDDMETLLAAMGTILDEKIH